ncbi:DNA repair and recombination protein RAD54B-like isoform X2 [Ornithodoros turicata]|uniref:DNA repair and recombination protein RAD54B-like isoform X2 n=1 Tax=Ornithodoros turicata TaxID=34597 RepID=UPI003138B2DA
MRKSAVASQSSHKRFVSPFVSHTAALGSSVPKVPSSATAEDVSTFSGQSKKRSINDVMKLLSQATDDSPENSPKKYCVEDKVPPVAAVASAVGTAALNDTARCNDDSSGDASSCTTGPIGNLSLDAHYFSVMWCKQSTKKHKKWEGDGVLIIKGRCASLRTLEGKEIATTFGYKASEVSNIQEGSIFKLSGKECEVQGIISSEEYLSGQCFTGSTSTSGPLSTRDSNTACQGRSIPAIPFKTPHIGETGTESGQTARKFHVPNVPVIQPDSLVLPRPSHTQQGNQNRNQLPVTDVVVEASLARCLRPHQKEGLVFLYESIMNMRAFNGSGAILADEMGLGKTLQCIALIWTLLRQGPYGGKPCLRKVLIITPSSLVKNWVKEFKKWLMNRNLRVYHVDQNNKIEGFLRQPSLYPVLILSYEMCVRCAESLSNVTFDLLVCDEAHRLKNANIKTTACLQTLGIDKRILLTGTPVQNDLQEFYALIDFCNPGILGTPSSFRRVYQEPILQSKLPTASPAVKELGEARTEELSRLTSLFILRRTQEVIKSYLPGKVEYVVFCQPQPLQLRLYHAYLQSNAVRSCLTSYLSCDATSHLACILALRKLCNHPLLVQEPDEEILEPLQIDVQNVLPPDLQRPGVSLELHSGKMRVVAKLLSSMWSVKPLRRIVIVSSFTKTLDLLQQLCSQKKYPVVRLDGSTSSVQRMELVDRFNSPSSDCFVFLLSSKAGGVGLNLVGANRILLYDVDWNPANDLQAMARVWRDGQANDVSVYRLLTTGTVEEKIFQRQIMKQELSGTVLENKKENQKFSSEDLKDLFSLDETTACSTHDLLGCPCQQENNLLLDDADFDIDYDTEGQKESKPQPRQTLQPKGYPVKLGKKVGMEDLLKWEHIAAPINLMQTQDPHLASASQDITFVFRNVVQVATTPSHTTCVS